MKSLLLLGLLLCPFLPCKAQRVAHEVRHHMDSLLTRMNHDSAFAATLSGDPDFLDRTFDSMLRISMPKYIDSCTAANEYNWPWCYLIADQRPQDHIPHPSPTGQYLLFSKYGISMKSVMAGCLVSSDMIIHDSLMLVAIRKKYGQDFFSRFQQEAAVLDRQKAGLILPYVHSSQRTLSLLNNTFATADSLWKAAIKTPDDLHLIIRFENGRVTDARWAGAIMGAVMPLQNGQDAQLLKQIQAMDWQPPRFQQQPVDVAVIYSFAQDRLAFYEYQ